MDKKQIHVVFRVGKLGNFWFIRLDGGKEDIAVLKDRRKAVRIALSTFPGLDVIIHNEDGTVVLILLAEKEYLLN